MARQLTVLFLAIFILVKANPYYYSFQYFPQVMGINSVQTFSVREKPDHQNFLVRVQKSIVEKNYGAALPAIKFSGIPFTLFALSTLALAFSLRIYPIITESSKSSRLCFAFCVLRL